MTVAVPAERFEQEFSSRLKRLSQSVRMPGFRPGKVPMKMIEAQYGGKLLQEVASDLIQSTFAEAAGREGLRPAGGPRIEPKSLARGQDFEYTAVFEVYPEIQQVAMPAGTIVRPVCDITEEDVDRTLDTMRRQRQSWAPVEREAREGDRVEIDFRGSLDGQPFEGGEGKDFPLVLGSGSLLQGFEQGLVGAKPGESRALDVRFPDDYRHAALAGKNVRFDVTVKRVAEPVLPEVDADFVKQLGIADGDVSTLRAEVRAGLAREADARVKSNLKQQAFKALMDANPIDIPQGLVDSEARRLADMARVNLEAQGVPAEQLPQDSGPYQEQARQRVSLGLVLAELVKANGIKIDQAQVRTRLEELARSYESPQEFIQWHYARPERLAEVESLVMEEQAVALLLGAMQVEDKHLGFQELMQANAG